MTDSWGFAQIFDELEPLPRKNSEEINELDYFEEDNSEYLDKQLISQYYSSNK